MLKSRVVGVVLVRSGIVVQSVGFRTFLPVGRPEIAIAYLDRWGIDEIVLLHMDAGRGWTAPRAAHVASYASRCRVPLGVGGGLVDVSQVQEAIHAGADKVVVNSALISAPRVVSETARLFGSQCVVASIDARREGDGRWRAYVAGGTQPAGIDAADLAARAQDLGAGEVLITSIDRDGSRRGYDTDLIASVVDRVRIPVIACGGAGHPEHLGQAFAAGATAAAAANFFHFTEHSVIVTKQALRQRGGSVRLDSYATYDGFDLDAEGRITKLPDDRLEALRFQYIPEEII